MNCTCPTPAAEPPIVLHIILFVLSIFWPFLVIGVSMIGVKMKEDYLDALNLTQKGRTLHIQGKEKEAPVAQ